MNITENKLAAALIVNRTIPQVEKALAGEVNQAECAEFGVTGEQWGAQHRMALAEMKYAKARGE